jgi:hypothetical protein
MGTLFSQKERDFRIVSPNDVVAFLNNASKVAKKCNVSVAEVIEAAKVLEMERRNSLYVANGDTLDEQLAGFGELIQELTSTIKDLKGEE